MTKPLRKRRDTDFAAPVIQVETTTFVLAGDGERIVDRFVTNFEAERATEAEPESIEWPHAAMFSFDELAFHVPETARRLVRSYVGMRVSRSTRRINESRTRRAQRGNR